MDSVKKPKLVALGALGIVVPVALAFTAYMVSRTTIGSAGTVPSLTHTPAQIEVSETEPDSAPSTTPTTGRQQGSGGGSVTPQPAATDDHGGKCSEPEHVNDPSCQSGDSSGPGSGGDGSGGGGGGGDDSSNSGHGSGGDD
jgi:hypothetical protein